MTQLSCKTCERIFFPLRHTRACMTAAGVGALVGALATQSLLGAVLVGGATYAIAAGLDSWHFARYCPDCGGLAVPMHNGRDRSQTITGSRPIERAAT
jgi:hypothetical protein